MAKLFAIAILSIFFILIDLYIYQAIKTLSPGIAAGWRKFFMIIFWGITTISILSVFLLNTSFAEYLSKDIKKFIVVGLVLVYFSKTFGVLTLLIDDIYRAGLWVIQKINGTQAVSSIEKSGDIPRSEFIAKATLAAIALPMATFSIGIATGAHDYRVRRRTIHLPNLPAAYDGLRIGQLSDIHSGSFFNRKSVSRGIELFMSEKPDLAFFTGDLVNDVASEVAGYKDIFSRISAPLGVYSTLGNHDYGDYMGWPSAEKKKKNLSDLIQVQREMGWDILLNEHRTITVDNEQLSVIGVENWGAGRFSKYGNLKKAYKGTEDTPVKLLLSHDPSHWDAQIRPEFKDIDITFAGHTHGFQFGLELGDFRWSPSQYIYKQWADLYQEDNQYLYVNRGFGYIGYPGRIGILPEITMIELKKA